MNAKEILSQLTLQEKAALCSGRDFWHTKGIDRLGIESIMMCDGPNGLRKQVGETDHLGLNESMQTVCYPCASALASSFDRDVMKKLGEALGQECQAEHIGMLLGPGINIKRSPLCGRNFEYYSEDPVLSGEMGAAFIRALQSKGIAACVKHFACNNQETRRMSANSVVDARALHEIYLPAFETAVKKGKTRSVMCAYNAVNGSFCAENKTLLTYILREKWSFDGFVVTDWCAIKDRAKGIQAGVDLEMPGGPKIAEEELIDAVLDGTLSEEALDRAAGNVLQFMLDAAEGQRKDAEIDRDACRILSKELAAECAVLLKNQGVLPLRETQKVAFIGEFAKTPRYQGAGSSHVNVAHAVGAAEAADGKGVLFARGYDAKSTVANRMLEEEAVLAAKEADVAVVFAGLPDGFETEGVDRTHLRLPDNQNELIHAVAAVNHNTVVVLHGGSVMELPWLNEVDAVLLMHLGGEQVGAAAVELLYGEKNPSGCLAETWPLRVQDNPSYLSFPGDGSDVRYAESIFVGYRYYDKKEMSVAFPFGYGMSYTDYTYGNLRIDKDRISDRECLHLAVDVTNTGTRFGKAVVQVYVRNAEGTVRRPVRELRDYAKVALEPGETKTAEFVLDKRAFAYYEQKIGDFCVESGDYTVEIGSDSRTVAVSAAVRVESTAKIPFTVTETTPIGMLLKHPKGASLLQMLTGGESNGSDPDTLGEGTAQMMKKVLMTMPLGVLVSLGRMSRKQLIELIAMLND